MANESLIRMLLATDSHPVPKSESAIRRVHEWNERRRHAFRTLETADLVESWEYQPDLCNADLTGLALNTINLRLANLHGVKLSGASLQSADLSGANLSSADLRGTNLTGANLSEAVLADANLDGAILTRSALVGTDFSGANLCRANVFGIAAWALKLDGAKQSDLIITPAFEPTVTVDSLEMAQIIYLLLENKRVRDIIDTITSKVVLILGRFAEERKQVLDAIRNELRTRDYTPVLFDFEKPSSRDLTETVSTLAHMARFVIADITDAKSIPQELSQIIPNLPSVPIQPVLLASDGGFAMFEHWRRYPWVLPEFVYKDEAHLLASISEMVIEPSERKRQEHKETQDSEHPAA